MAHACGPCLWRLADAASRYSMTRLNQCLAELENTGPDGAPVAAYLRTLVKAHDMEGIETLLEQVAKAQRQPQSRPADESSGDS